VPPVSDEDVARKVERVEKLRQQVADANAKRLENERAQTNSIQFAQLEAEEARLELELTRAKSASTVSAAKSGASAPLDAAKASMEAAVAAQKEEKKLQGADSPSTPVSATTTSEGS
jgi:hypothetical protein